MASPDHACWCSFRRHGPSLRQTEKRAERDTSAERKRHKPWKSCQRRRHKDVTFAIVFRLLHLCDSVTQFFAVVFHPLPEELSAARPLSITGVFRK